MAKGCDREILRTLITLPKAVLWTIEIEFCVVTGLSTKCNFKTILFMSALLQKYVMMDQWLWDFVVWPPRFVLDPNQAPLTSNQSNMNLGD